VREVPAGAIFWRSQLAHAWRREEEIDDFVPFPASPERMKPLADRAQEGRANPKGIPCLYLSTSEEAALSEARPWIGAYLSLAQFETVRPLRLVDCSVHDPNSLNLVGLLGEATPDEIHEAVWADVDRAFAEPVTRSDDTAEYAATQIIAETFRSAGYDGIVFKSFFDKQRGFNLALFDTETARQLNCSLFEAKNVTYEFSEQGETYYLPKPHIASPDE